MQMTYLPNASVIIQDDPDRTIIATISKADVDGVSVPLLAKAMALAPTLVCLIDDLPEVVDFDEFRLSEKTMDAIRNIRSAFTGAERVELTHYVYMLK